MTEKENDRVKVFFSPSDTIEKIARAQSSYNVNFSSSLIKKMLQKRRLLEIDEAQSHVHPIKFFFKNIYFNKNLKTIQY